MGERSEKNLGMRGRLGRCVLLFDFDVYCREIYRSVWWRCAYLEKFDSITGHVYMSLHLNFFRSLSAHLPLGMICGVVLCGAMGADQFGGTTPRCRCLTCSPTSVKVSPASWAQNIFVHRIHVPSNMRRLCCWVDGVVRPHVSLLPP